MAITARITDTSRAIHVLEGILKGIAADKKINIEEMYELKRWLDNHKNLSDVYPFSEAYELIDSVLEDGIIDKEEQEEILDFCNSFEALDGPIDRLTKEMRNLHGFLHGIIADKRVNKKELKALQKWMKYHKSNLHKWPFDELYILINTILKDGIVTEEEQREFIDFTKGFIEDKAENAKKDPSVFVNRWMNSDAPTLKTIDRIIDKNIKIKISKKTFCFTGQMKSGKRKDMQNKVAEIGGIPMNNISRKTDYLVIGALSNPCWAYSTYGRKIEAVMNNRKMGINTYILHEDDFISAIETA